METTTQVFKLSNIEMTEAILALQAQVAKLEALTQPRRNDAQREMTDDDARRILIGDLATTKHKDAASTLGLSYGQIYSCRLEFTFKHIHKEMIEANQVNAWKK